MGNDSRKNVGIIFNHGKDWLGGVYYLLNVIQSLEVLSDAEKPFLTVFYRESSAEFIDKITYPYKKLIAFDFTHKYLGYAQALLSGKNIYAEQFIKDNELDGLFPLNDFPCKIKKSDTTTVAWIPDLQHRFYPEYFSRSNRVLREERIKLILKNGTDLVVSSEDVKSHFYKFYKIPEKLKIHTLPFVSLIKDTKLPEVKSVLDKYSLPKKYFIVSNQFYEHKNHLLIIEALKIIRKQGKRVKFVFTGKIDDSRYTGYLTKLRTELDNEDIQSDIRLLGLIPREEQLALLKNALSIVQPSLFEGWSTIVEDAKSLQAQIISSDLDVHKEQLGEKGIFFKRDSSKDLAKILLQKWENPLKEHELFDNYEERVQLFAASFVKIFI